MDKPKKSTLEQTKRILLEDNCGMRGDVKSIGQAITEAGIDQSELQRSYIEVERGWDGDYAVFLYVQEECENPAYEQEMLAYIEHLRRRADQIHAEEIDEGSDRVRSLRRQASEAEAELLRGPKKS